jgi:hypothetical protein
MLTKMSGFSSPVENSLLSNYPFNAAANVGAGRITVDAREKELKRYYALF